MKYLPSLLRKLLPISWCFHPSRWRRKARLTPVKRWWWGKTHEVCCLFDRSLYAWLAPRLERYLERYNYGAPVGYPDPENAADDGTETDFDQWRADVARGARAFRLAAGGKEYEWDDQTRQEIEWAMQWLALWHGGVWA